MPSSPFSRTSRPLSRRMVNQSTKSIEGWYGTRAHGGNPSFRAPQVQASFLAAAVAKPMKNTGEIGAAATTETVARLFPERILAVMPKA